MAMLILLYNATYFGIASWFPWLEGLGADQELYVFVLSFLFLIPLVYASAVFRLRGALITWSIFLAATLPHIVQQSAGLESSLRVGLFALVALLLGIFVALEYSPAAKASKQAAVTRGLSLAKLLKVQESDRRHLSRELHDNTIQSLLVIANRAHALETGDYGELSPGAKKQAEQIMVMLLQAIDDVRRLSRDLRPSVLDNVGLLPSLRWSAERLSHENEIKVEVVVKGKEHRLPPDFEIAIFRIAQEALNNVIKHSKATVATMTLDFMTSDFKLTVRDNGHGFHVPQTVGDFAIEGKLGLERMQQHAALINGTFNIRSEPSKGTEVTVQARP
jgi:signal transduction histidine kinase